MDREAWRAAVHGVTKSWTKLSNWTEWPVDFPYFFQFKPEFCSKELKSHSQFPSLFLLTIKSFSIFSCKEYNQSNSGIDHLVMSMCRVISCVIGRGCLLWPVHYLDITLLAFALLHLALQGQTCLLLQVSSDFLLLHYSPWQCKNNKLPEIGQEEVKWIGT